MGAGRRARSISGTSARLVGVERAGLIRSWGGCLQPQLDKARQRLLTSGATLPVGRRVPTIGGGRGAGPHGLHCPSSARVGPLLVVARSLPPGCAPGAASRVEAAE